MAYVKVLRNCKSLCGIITVRGKWGAVKIDFRSHDWRMMASWFLEGLFPQHWANLYSSLNGLVTWCPSLFNLLSTAIKNNIVPCYDLWNMWSLKLLIDNCYVIPLWKELLLWMALTHWTPQFLWLLGCGRTQAVMTSVFRLHRRLGSPAGVCEQTGHPVAWLWAIAGPASGSGSYLQEEGGIFSQSKDKGRHSPLQRGREAGRLTLLRIIQDSIALHSNGRLIDRSYRLRTATHTVINPLRESVKLACIEGWLHLCGPIEAIAPSPSHPASWEPISPFFLNN